MNFLSHFYFDRKNPNPYEVLGIVLPDLLKNANKNWNLHPEKNESHYDLMPHQKSILKGWKRHLKVDQLFHNSIFFKYHQHEIKLILRDILKDSQVKPFFIGHISLELLLDSLLITRQIISVDFFYHQLNAIEKSELDLFLRLNKIENTEQFHNFYTKFISERYVYSYAEESKIAYALRRICMRIWENPFSLAQENEITERLIKYKKRLSEEFIIIFDDIESQLN
jgi:hypothetical protein